MMECHGHHAVFDSDHLQIVNVTMAFPYKATVHLIICNGNIVMILKITAVEAVSVRN